MLETIIKFHNLEIENHNENLDLNLQINGLWIRNH